MYTISLKKNMVAQHYLPNERGAESQKHSHSYTIEICLSGNSLDENGYLVNFLDIENILENLIMKFKDKTLNDLKEFQGTNPSLENFARIFCESMIAHIQKSNVKFVKIKIWEKYDMWASYKREI